MNKHLLLTFSCLFFIASLSAQKTAKRELRGVWITTHLGLDWPVRSQSVTQKQTALANILEHHRVTGMNAVYFQVRSQSDAMYPSTIEPWAAILNPGHVQGMDPGWDPLLFAITESRKRGLEFHAWINPYRAIANIDSLPRFSPQHVARQHPEWLITGAGKERILNPGLPAVRDYLVTVIADIVNRYDIDGIHFDDYFYPNAAFNDDVAYLADPRGFPATTAGRADWRRDNVSILIRRVNDLINSTKPWVKFGVSPSGIYRNGTTVGGSATSGLEHYTTLYADTKKWIQEGWVDYLAPQLYWYIGQPGSNYSVLVPWWNNNASGRHIYIGQAQYKLADPALYGANWNNSSEIPNQMRLNRNAAYPNVHGEIAFRTAFLLSNTQKVRDSMRLNIYKRPALPPVMPWHDNTAPGSPTGLTAVKQANHNYVLTWTAPPPTTVEGDKVRQYVIYRSESPIITTADTANLLAITPTTATTYTDLNTTNKTFYYTVTAVDRGYVESAPSNVTDYQAPAITCPSAQSLEVDGACAVALPDYRSSASVSDDVTPTSAITITQSPAAGTVLSGTGTTVLTLTATDLSGKTSSCTFNVVRKDNTAPQMTCPAAITVGTDAGICTATVSPQPPAATDNCGTPTVTGTRSDAAALTAPYPKGTTTITWTARDVSGNSTTCTQTVTVEDREAPAITGITADPSVLFPPNRKMRNVTITYTATDNCGPVTTSLSITSNEIDSDGEADWEVLSTNKVKLRAERWGYGTGRIYTITITATDAVGNTTAKTVTVTVPHDQGNVTVTDKVTESNAVLLQPWVAVSPNPSAASFQLTLSGSSKDLAAITVKDNLGRVVEAKSSVAPGSVVYVGKDLRPGVYYIEVVQGDRQERIKVVKQ